MASYNYGFVNARVGAMKSYLLDEVEMKSLMDSRNFEDALALLKNTGYGKELSKLSSPSLAEIENVFSQSLRDDFRKLAGSVTGISKAFLTHYARRFEIEALKLLLIMKSKGEDIKKYPWIMQRITAVPMAEKLVDVETPGEIVEMLRNTKYYPALQKAVSEYNEQGTAYPFIAALDTYLYAGLNNLIRKMGGKDRKIAERLVGIEVDAKNLLMALRMRGTEAEDISRWMIPSRYRLPDSELMAAYNAKKITEIQQVFKHYSHIISSGIKEYEATGSLFGFENEFRKHLIKESYRIFGGDRFHIGIVLAYLNMKENEVINLTSILHGKEEGLSSAEIEETVIMPA
jgi:V/A-type H+-transporting ATPase subunit C